MTISPPPTAPSRQDPATFSDRADAFAAWLVGAVPQFNDLAVGSIDSGNFQNITVAGTITGSGAQNLPALISAASDTGAVTTSQTRAIIASEDARVAAARSIIAASQASQITAGTRNAIVASNNGQNTGDRSGIIAGDNHTISANRAAVIGGDDCTASGTDAIVTGSRGCVSSASAGIIAGSRNVINTINFSFAMGDSESGPASGANRTIHMFSSSGDVQIAGSLSSSHTFSDFAEMFPNATGAEIPLGTIVAEEGGAVRPAGPGDEIAGVVTATAVVTAGDTPFAWQGRYLSDEWGRPIMEEIPDPDWGGEGDAPMIEVRKENPDWNPEAPQVPRSERPAEWTRVGLLGQVFTRVAENVVPGDKLSAVDGIGFKSTSRTGLRCMTITQPYDAAKGYAVARCLVNVRV